MFFTFLKPALLALLLTSCVAANPKPDAPAPDGAGGAVSPAAEPAVVTERGYVLGRGDRIAIQVFDEPDLTLEARVSDSGSINYSYLGDLRVAGKTSTELEELISGLLENGYLVNPAVNVSIVEFRPFFINGEVRSPGSYPFQPGLTLDKAITLAGGLTDRASARRMFVQRAAEAEKGMRSMELNDPVGPGDTITIKEGFF